MNEKFWKSERKKEIEDRRDWRIYGQCRTSRSWMSWGGDRLASCVKYGFVCAWERKWVSDQMNVCLIVVMWKKLSMRVLCACSPQWERVHEHIRFFSLKLRLIPSHKYCTQNCYRYPLYTPSLTSNTYSRSSVAMSKETFSDAISLSNLRIWMTAKSMRVKRCQKHH